MMTDNDDAQRNGTDGADMPATRSKAASPTDKPLDIAKASQAVTDYVRRRFWLPIFRYDRTPDRVLRLNGDQWRAIRDALEPLYGLADLRIAMQLARGRDANALSACEADDDDDDDDDEDGPDEDGYRVVDGGADPGLPHGWLTLLEAAYERLGDAKGLERLYAYYICNNILRDDDDCDDDDNAGGGPGDSVDNTYIGRLHDLVMRSAEDKPSADTLWRTMLGNIVEAFEYADDPGFPVDSRSYETLLARERLSDAAWRYCETHADMQWHPAQTRDLLDRLFDAAAINHATEICELLLLPLHDADSDLMSEDSEENRREILRTLERCAAHLGVERAHAEAGRLHRLYRGRKELRESLARFLAGLDDDAESAQDEENVDSDA